MMPLGRVGPPPHASDVHAAGPQALAELPADRAVADDERARAVEIVIAGRGGQPLAPVVRAHDLVEPLGEHQHAHQRIVGDGGGGEAGPLGDDEAARAGDLDRDLGEAGQCRVQPSGIGRGQRRARIVLQPQDVEPADLGERREGNGLVDIGEPVDLDPIEREHRLEQRPHEARRDDDGWLAHSVLPVSVNQWLSSFCKSLASMAARRPRPDSLETDMIEQRILAATDSLRGLDRADNRAYENGFYWYGEPSRIAKLLAHHDLYRSIAGLPGDIVELGVYKAASFIRFATFRSLLRERPVAQARGVRCVRQLSA